MKLSCFFLILFCSCISSISYAQIKVVDGKVGINELNPTALLQITSTVPSQGVLFCKGTSNNELFRIQQGGAGHGNFFMEMEDGTRTIQLASGSKFYISSPGNVGIDQQNPSADLELGTENGGGGVAAKPGGGPWIATSDLKSKKDVNNYKDGLDMLLKFNPIKYRYNGKFGTPNNTGVEYVGLIAQDVQKIAPYMVLNRKYNTATLEQEESAGYNPADYEEDFLAIDANALTYMFINAFKEQQQMLEEKDREIKEMADLLHAQQVQITEIQAQISTLKNKK